MVRPAGSLEVYKQKQNILFIFENVEHTMFKVTWARLWARLSTCVECMHGRVCVSSVCKAECMAECSGICMARRFVRLGSDARPGGS